MGAGSMESSEFKIAGVITCLVESENFMPAVINIEVKVINR